MTRPKAAATSASRPCHKSAPEHDGKCAQGRREGGNVVQLTDSNSDFHSALGTRHSSLLCKAPRSRGPGIGGWESILRGDARLCLSIQAIRRGMILHPSPGRGVLPPRSRTAGPHGPRVNCLPSRATHAAHSPARAGPTPNQQPPRRISGVAIHLFTNTPCSPRSSGTCSTCRCVP